MSQRNRNENHEKDCQNPFQQHASFGKISAGLQFFRRETSMRTNKQTLNPSSDLTGQAALFGFKMAFVFSLFLDGLDLKFK